jgi:hypothetical protein
MRQTSLGINQSWFNCSRLQISPEFYKMNVFCHVLNIIGYPMKEKLIRSNCVLVCMRFRIDRYVEAPGERLVYVRRTAQAPRSTLIPLQLPSGDTLTGTDP